MSTRKPSKFRHIFAKPRNLQTYDDITIGSASQESSLIAASRDYLAVPWKQGNGQALVVYPLAKPGRVSANIPQGAHVLFGHDGKITDYAFSPFHHDLLVTASEDSTLKLWKIAPKNSNLGVSLGLKDFSGEFLGHDRKVNAVSFHSHVDGLMASMGNDKTVKLWDLETQKEHFSSAFPSGSAFNVSWNFTGSHFVSANSDKKFYVVDPRSNGVSHTVETTNSGSRSFRAIWKGQEDKVVTVGFSKTSDRQIQVYDLKNTDEPLATCNIDSSGCTMMPTFDETLNILYIAGRGEATIKLFEIGTDDYIEYLTTHSCSAPLTGITNFHKTTVNVKTCCTMSFITVTAKNVVPVDFFVPRKSEYFQDDIYPLVAENAPVLKTSEWAAGETMAPNMISLKPEGMKAQSEIGPIEALKPKYDFKAEQEKINAKNVGIESFEKIGSIDRFIAYNNIDEEEKKKPVPVDDDW
jgi:coronin-1B/1C/6